MTLKIPEKLSMVDIFVKIYLNSSRVMVPSPSISMTQKASWISLSLIVETIFLSNSGYQNKIEIFYFLCSRMYFQSKPRALAKRL